VTEPVLYPTRTRAPFGGAHKKAREKMGNKKKGTIKIDGKDVCLPADLLDGVGGYAVP
jgi:hypothetical protein